MAIEITVVYALPEAQTMRTLSVPADSSIADVIAASGLVAEFPEIDLSVNRVGIFGRRLPLETKVGEGDRVEIYRPLKADPKESRRRRAEHARKARQKS